MPERPSTSSLSDRARQLLAEIRSLAEVDFSGAGASSVTVVRERYEVLTLAPWSCRVPCRVPVAAHGSSLRVAV